MEIRELRAFLEVAREENMTRAAGNLHMSQPSLSKLIKSLEHELGAKLFVRRSFGLTLTKEGRVLRERARDLVGMANRIEDEFASLGNISPGRSRFCANRPRICGITWKAASLRRCLSISIRARSISPCSRRTPI